MTQPGTPPVAEYRGTSATMAMAPGLASGLHRSGRGDVVLGFKNRFTSFLAPMSILCRSATRAAPARPIRSSSAGAAVRASAMASTSGSTAPAGTSQPLTPGSTSSGIPATYVLITGRPQGQRLHDHHRQSLGKAGQYQGPGGLQLLADTMVVQNSR